MLLQNSTMNGTANNTSSDPGYVLGTIYLLICVLVVTANSIVVCVVVRTRALHLPTMWVIANMAAADFVLAIVFLVIVVPSAYYGQYAYPDRLLNFSGCLLSFFSQQAFCNTAMTVLDRALAVKWPLRYPRIASSRNYGLIILTVVLLNLACLPDIQARYESDVALSFGSLSSTWAVALRQISVIGSCLVVIGGLITIAAVSCHTRIHDRDHTIEQDTSSKPTLMILLTTSVYIVCNIPAVVLIFLRMKYGSSLNIWIPRVVVVGNLSNSLWNVFIYTATYRPFREALLSVFCKSYLRRLRQADMLRDAGTTAGRGVTSYM